jgi:hypothetical protein
MDADDCVTRIVQTHQIQLRRRHIARRAHFLVFVSIVAFILLLMLHERIPIRSVAREDERHRITRVRRMRRAGFGIAHLLRVAVVGGDEEDVPEEKAVSSSAAS